jgi:hypothetical protein
MMEYLYKGEAERGTHRVIRKEPGVPQDAQPVERSRITLLAGAFAAAFTLTRWRSASAAASILPEVTVYKTPT